MGFSLRAKRRARKAWVFIWTTLFLLSLGGWVFSFLYSWCPLDRRNNDRLTVMLHSGAVEIRNLIDTGWLELRGSSGNRLNRVQFPPVPIGQATKYYRFQLGLRWPRVHVEVGKARDEHETTLERFLNKDRLRPGDVSWRVWIPFWLPTVVSFVCVAPFIIKVVRRRSVPVGHCSKCRYDLTGNESGTCPECGEEVPVPTVPEGTS